MSWPGRSVGRWIVVAVGLGVIAVGLVVAMGPYRETREFRAAVACGRGNDCFEPEAASIVGRSTYITTTTDSNGHTTSTTTHYEVTWQRADGSRQKREVSEAVYDKAEKGQPATLRVWRGEVVRIEVAGETAWFPPEAAEQLIYCFLLAYFGLGVLLWGLFFGWWDGFFHLGFRTFAWMFAGLVPAHAASGILAYGLHFDFGLIVVIIFGVLFAGLAAGMLFASLDG